MNKLLEFKNVSLTYQTIDDEIDAIKGMFSSTRLFDSLP